MKNDQTVGDVHDRELRLDLEIVARAQPGRGDAFRRLMARSGVTQQDIADHLGCTRVMVSHWVNEKKWPAPKKLLDTLLFMRIDRAVLAEAAALLVGNDMVRDVVAACGTLNVLEVTRDQMLDLLSGKDDFEQRDLIFKTFTPHVALAMALRSAGMKGGESADVRAQKLFFDERRLHEEEARRRELGSRSLPPAMQGEWHLGNVVEVEADDDAD